MIDYFCGSYCLLNLRRLQSRHQRLYLLHASDTLPSVHQSVRTSETMFPWYWSLRLARSHYCQLLTLPLLCLWLCLSVCHAPSNCYFFFVCRWNRAIFWPSVLHVALYKTVLLDFWFRPPNAQNLLPKICTKSPITRLVWQIDRRCFGLTGFSGMADSMEPCKMLWGRPLLPWQRHFG